MPICKHAIYSMTMFKNVNVGMALACVMIVLSVGASIGYALSGDVRRAIYWAAAAVITAAVTF